MSLALTLSRYNQCGFFEIVFMILVVCSIGFSSMFSVGYWSFFIVSYFFFNGCGSDVGCKPRPLKPLF